ncbi:hypothetical protein HHK36_014163 [Tetracentron sinense]|uniref:Uncharacterized protein n=1 Tax=Tetracentron sinense TaxID=13715 RepID=A0A834Z7P0_TETSI|nr:hypothetical protein HHK36_014163 [Tetracentron sinense]
MDTKDTSPSVLLFFDKQRFIFNYEEQRSGGANHRPSGHKQYLDFPLTPPPERRCGSARAASSVRKTFCVLEQSARAELIARLGLITFFAFCQRNARETRPGMERVEQGKPMPFLLNPNGEGLPQHAATKARTEHYIGNYGIFY